MEKTEYYELVENFKLTMKFKEVHEKWYKCFSYILKSFKVGYTEKTIKSLFYDFEMCNWKAMWKENSEYKGHSKKQMFESFISECSYVSDRTSYDRLFRTHWLFLNTFEKEIHKVKYPELNLKFLKTNK